MKNDVLFTLFLWDINEQKKCQSFYCGFSYLDSLSDALTTRILNSNDLFRIFLLNSNWNRVSGLELFNERAKNLFIMDICTYVAT